MASRSNAKTTRVAMQLPGPMPVHTIVEQGSHTADPDPLLLRVSDSPSYRLRIQARLLPTFSQQAQRAASAPDPLPDLDPLLEVWEQDLMPWETEPLSRADQTLPWEGDTFSWEPASRNAVPFTASRKASSTPHRVKNKCRKPRISTTRRSPRVGKAG